MVFLKHEFRKGQWITRIDFSGEKRCLIIDTYLIFFKSPQKGILHLRPILYRKNTVISKLLNKLNRRSQNFYFKLERTEL